jgi:hypothetical protein
MIAGERFPNAAATLRRVPVLSMPPGVQGAGFSPRQSAALMLRYRSP